MFDPNEPPCAVVSGILGMGKLPLTHLQVLTCASTQTDLGRLGVSVYSTVSNVLVSGYRRP